MSNCIHFHNPEVRFTAKEFDVASFRERWERLKEQNPNFMSGGDEENREAEYYQKEADRYFCWFLTLNSRFDAGDVIISFGEGYSTHTWRDFRYTMSHLLAPYLKRFKTHTFKLSDEFDGFESCFHETVVFKPRRKVA